MRQKTERIPVHNMKMSRADKRFTVILFIIMFLVCAVIVYPLYYVLVASLTDPVVVNSGKMLFYPERSTSRDMRRHWLISRCGLPTRTPSSIRLWEP